MSDTPPLRNWPLFTFPSHKLQPMSYVSVLVCQYLALLLMPTGLLTQRLAGTEAAGLGVTVCSKLHCIDRVSTICPGVKV